MKAAIKNLKTAPLFDRERENSWCVKAVSVTFESMLGLKPVPAKQEDWSLGEEPIISGVMGFIRDGLEGTMTLTFSQSMIMKSMSQFYGEDLTSMSDKVVGGVGELTNIIFSMLKEEYNQHGMHFQMCLPVVVVGRNHSIVAVLSNQKFRMKFETELGEFGIEVAFIGARGNGRM